MTLVKVRAAFEKAITDAVTDVDPSVKMVYDNTSYTNPGKTIKYITISVNFGQAVLQSQGNSSSYYSGSIQCNVHVPKLKGTSVLSKLSEAVVTGMTSVNDSTYQDVYSCTPKTRNFGGPGMFDTEDESHFIGVLICEFSANA
tara:strand:- start:266 stop:694 length:429 start_codon:yes stop_codon:yes gene_type:complete